MNAAQMFSFFLLSAFAGIGMFFIAISTGLINVAFGG
jgi:hypothetical protein